MLQFDFGKIYIYLFLNLIKTYFNKKFLNHNKAKYEKINNIYYYIYTL